VSTHEANQATVSWAHEFKKEILKENDNYWNDWYDNFSFLISFFLSRTSSFSGTSDRP